MFSVGRRTRGGSDALPIRASTVSTADAAIASCSAKTSSRSWSYRDDASTLPSATLTSCVVMRTRLPALRTLPVRRIPTWSFSPIARGS